MGIQKQSRVGAKVDPRISLPDMPELVGKPEVDQPALGQFWQEVRETFNRFAQDVSGATRATTTTPTTTETTAAVQEPAPSKVKDVEASPVVIIKEVPTVNFDRILTNGVDVLVGADGNVLWE